MQSVFHNVGSLHHCFWGVGEEVLYLYVSKSISNFPTADCVSKSTIFPTSVKLQLKMVEGLFIWEQRTLQQYCRTAEKTRDNF